MIALYKKELRALLPLLVVVGLLFSADFIYRPLDGGVDEVSWVDQSSQLNPGEGKEELAVILMIFALVAAYSVFPREHDEKTIEFLYALPVRRSHIFFAKALAAWTVLMFGVGLEILAGGFFQALNPQSFSGEQWRFGLAFQLTVLDGFYCALILCHGLLISFLRRLGLLVYLVLGLLVAFIKKQLPEYAFLDPNELLALEYRGSTLVIPWSDMLFHGVVALVAGALAYVLWMGAAERGSRLYAQIRSKRSGRLALGCVSVLTFIVGFSGFMMLAASAPEDPDPVQYRGFLPARASTTWYDFTYPSNLGERARELIQKADQTYEEVAAFLGEEREEGSSRIDADLTDIGAGHQGIAQGGVIRVALESLSAEDALYTLYHETVHAFQFELAGRKANEHSESLRFFVEGSAEYVSRQLRPDPGSLQAHRRLAAAAFDRHDLRFEQLLSDSEFKKTYDPNLVYVLGETWTSALAETCGEGIVGRFFRALDRPDVPENLDGIALWQDTLRATDCALEPAVARWNQRMSELVQAEQSSLDALPRLGGGVVEQGEDDLVFELRFDRAIKQPAETYFLRVRRDPSVPDDQVRTFTAEIADDGLRAEFRVPASWFQGGSFECQFGQSLEGSLWALFEEWQVISP